MPTDQGRCRESARHLLRTYSADPEALALLLESVGPAALALLGRALHRRLERLETNAG